MENNELYEQYVSKIKKTVMREQKVSKKLSQIGKLMDGLEDIQSVPRKGRLCYSLQGTNFLEIFPKKTCFIVRILTRRRKLKDKERIFKRKIGHKGGNIRVDKRTNVEYVIKLIKRAYKLELK